MFKAIVLEKGESAPKAQVAALEDAALPEGEVTINVEYSTINYKDALAISGKSPIVRKFPMVPGIDLAGTVEASTDARWKPGDRVLVNGWGVGESHWGGLAQRARMRSGWLTAVPAGLSTRDAMAIGTAGYTAMLCVMALEAHGVKPASGDVLVTGAGGGVGGFSIALLARLGYRVVASTGRPQESEYLKSLGAAEVIDRGELDKPGKPLGKERWAGAIDSVGSHTLANACAQAKYRGTVAACGLAQGMDFPASVAPFILRGVTLAGVDSVMAPAAEREVAWRRLGELVQGSAIAAITHEVDLVGALAIVPELLAGKVRGRAVVDVSR
ncbi:MAG: MDR family oxidoreductase [Gammaproteobacteria bacterium]